MNRFSIDVVPEDVSKKLAENTKKLRKQKKITQKDLAKRSGVSLGSIKRFESSGLISLSSLLKITLILGRLDDFKNLLIPEKEVDKIEKLFSKKAQQ